MLDSELKNFSSLPEDAACFPASPAQQRFWFAAQYADGNAANNIPMAWQIQGQLRQDYLQQSLNLLVARHESLRTTFHLQEDASAKAGVLMQVILPELPLPIELQDLRADANAHATALAMQQAQAVQPFDLQQGPLLRVLLCALPQQQYLLAVTLHHIIADAISLNIFMHELCSVYQALVQGQSPELPELPIQYADFSVWQEEQLATEKMQEQAEYWRSTLADAPPLLPLPLDFARPPQISHAGAAQPFALPAEQCQGLRALAQTCGASLFMSIAAIFNLLLAKYTREEDICIGYPVAGRQPAEVAGLIGCFVNTLVLRTQLTPEMSFTQLLQQVRNRILDNAQRQELPFERVLQAVQAPRNPAHSPIFQVMLSFNSAGEGELQLPGLQIRNLEPTSHFAKFDLTLNLIEHQGGLQGSLQYNTSLFSAASMARLSGHLQELVRSLLLPAAAQLPLRALPMMSGAEARSMCAWQPPASSAPVVGNLHALFEQQAARRPQAIALCFEQERLSYAELNQAANRLAHHLLEITAGQPQIIGICLPRSALSVVAILAVLKAACTYLPLDPEYPQQRIMHSLQDSACQILLSADETLQKLQGNGLQLAKQDLQILLLDSAPLQATLAQAGAHNPAPRLAATASSTAYIIYTSGSTGVPKGCAVTHGNVLSLLHATQDDFGFAADDVWTLFHSIAFDFSVWEIWGALAYGGRLVVVPYWVSRAAEDFHALLRQERVTVLNQTPTYFSQLIAVDSELPPASKQLALRYVIFGGEALDFQSLRRWVDKHGDQQPRLINMYGITETTVHVTLREVRAADLAAGRSLIGKPLRHLQVYLLDQGDLPVPLGVPGEIHVAGAGLSLGYLNRAELTQQRFVELNIDGQMVRCYRSGDLARRLADGELEYLGRIDKQIKLRGYRIELNEIETRLAACQGVAAAAVLLEQKQANPRLIAWAVPHETAICQQPEASARMVQALMQELQASLPAYMLPNHLGLLPALPLTANGKLDKAALPAVQMAEQGGAAFAAPQGELESQLAQIICQLLGLPQLDRGANFFHVGGDSIVAIQVVARARKLGLALHPRMLFENPSVAQMAVAAQAASIAQQQTKQASLPAASADEQQILLPIQHWFLQQQSGAALHHFNFSSLLRIAQGVSGPGLQQSLQQSLQQLLSQLYAKHPALRLRLRQPDGIWQAYYVAGTATVLQQSLQIVELGELPADVQRAAILQHASAVQSHLHLEHGPLFKLVAYDCGVERPAYLLLLAHHMLVDGVSWRILHEDIEQLLHHPDAAQASMPSSSAAAGCSLQQWGRLLAEYANSAELAQEKAYWLAQLRAPSASLPRDFDASERHAGQRQRHSIQLSAQATRSLLTAGAHSFQAQINDLLLSALMLACQSWGKLDALLIDLEGHGREDLFDDQDLSQTVGWFTSKFPLHLSLPAVACGAAADLTNLQQVAAVIRHVQASLRQIPKRGVGYGILRYLTKDAQLLALEQSAQAQICFNYLGQWHQENSADEAATLTPDNQISPACQFAHALDINGMVQNDCLWFDIYWHQSQYRAHSVAEFGAALEAALHAVIAACQQGLSNPVNQVLADSAPVRAPASSGPAPAPLPAPVPASALSAAYPDMLASYPASPIQKGMLFHSLGAAASSYVVQYRYHLQAVQPLLWQQALQALQQRHAILRTAFSLCPQHGFVQVVLRQATLPFVSHDLRHLEPHQQQAYIASALAQQLEQGFDLEQAGLFSCQLYLIAAQQAQFVFSFHHALLDGWSYSALLAELGELYQALLDGQAPALPAPVSYRAYIDWLQEQQIDTAQAWWRSQLQGMLPAKLAQAQAQHSEHGEHSEHTEHTEHLHLQISASLSAALQQQARQYGVTQNTVLQLAWGLSLAHLQGTAEVVFGITCSGRDGDIEGVEQIIGPMINSMPIRLPCRSTHSLAHSLRTLALQQWDGQSHAWPGLTEIARCAGLSTANELFDSLLVFENYPLSQSEQAATRGWQIQALDLHDQTHYPLTLLAAPGAQLQLKLHYRRTLIPSVQAQRLLARLEQMLKAVAQAPAASSLASLLALPVATQANSLSEA